MEDIRITEADFEELVCEIWRTKIENKRNDYRRELGIEPTVFKLADLPKTEGDTTQLFLV
jgi:hypothetical protein